MDGFEGRELEVLGELGFEAELGDLDLRLGFSCGDGTGSLEVVFGTPVVPVRLGGGHRALFQLFQGLVQLKRALDEQGRCEEEVESLGSLADVGLRPPRLEPNRSHLLYGSLEVLLTDVLPDDDPDGPERLPY